MFRHISYYNDLLKYSNYNFKLIINCMIDNKDNITCQNMIKNIV